MGENVNEDGLNKVAERFWGRRDVRDVCGDIETVKKILLEHARNPENQCMNCIYSAPYRGRLSWVKRYCVLKLKPNGKCPMQTPIVGNK